MRQFKVGQLASGSYSISGSFSGSFQGSGAGLNNIPASGITGLNLSQIATGSVTASVSLGTGSFIVTSGSSTFMFISSSGNVGIGTSSPSTTLHVAGNTTIGGASATTVSSTYNSTTRNQIRYTNNATLEFHEGVNERIRIGAGTGNFLINTTTDAGFKLDVNGTARITGNLNFVGSSQMIFNGAFYNNINDRNHFGGAVSISTFLRVGTNANTDVSSILQADSTTKGFLPPRTNLTSNISTPAQGLITYLTGSTNEGLYYYNSGSAVGWHKILTNSGSQEISGSLNVNNTLYVTGSNVGIGTSTPGSKLTISDGTRTGGFNPSVGLNAFSFGTITNHALVFATNNNDVGRIATTGNWLINTTTDAGFKLDVNGTARVKGASNVSSTTAFTIANSDSTNLLQVQDNGYIRIGSQATSAFRVYATDTSGDSEPSGLNLVLNSRVSSQTQGVNLGMVTINGAVGTATTGNQNVFLISKGFSPTSGTGTYAQLVLQTTINQTGGANGITRGLYIAPTLTSASDFRAIETTTGKVIFNGGNIGIGISSPSASLHISGASSANLLQIDSSASSSILFVSGSGRVNINTTASRFDLTLKNEGKIGSDFISDSFISLGNAIGLQANYNVYTLKNLAVGVGDVAARLGVRGSGATSATTALLVQNANASASLVVRDDGNVGIGTSSPAVALEISKTTPIVSLVSSEVSSFYGIEFKNVSSIDAEIKQFPSSGEFKISSGRNSSWGGFTTFYTDTVERMRIRSTGNVLIGTTTDAGFKLDVNGTARVKGAGATDSTNAFVVQNSAGSSALTVANGLTTIVHGDLQLVNTVLYWASASQIRNISNGVLRITNSSNSDFTRLQFGGGTTAFPSLQRSGSALAIMDATGTSLSNLLIGTTTDIASSKLTIESTTQGFLPPRTNLTSNISTPAQGLITYVTSSATEGLYYYNSGSYQGWTRLLNDSGSQSITGSLNVTSFTTSNAIISGNVTVLGTASINTLIVNQTQLSTGSNQLGDAADDFQTLYGTVRIPTGSLTVSGSVLIRTSGSAASTILGMATAAGNPVLTIYNGNSDTFPVGTMAFYYGSTNTGLINGLSNALGLRGGSTTGGNIIFASHITEVMRMTDTGLGIGTTTPLARLHISGASSANLLRIDSPALNNILFVTGSGIVSIGMSGSAYGSTGTSNGRLTINNTSGNNGLVIRNGETGYQLGIKTTTNDNIGTEFVWYDGGTTTFLQYGHSIGTRLGNSIIAQFRSNNDSSATIHTGGSTTERMRITSTGNVGIGTTSPSASLHVAGTTRISGSFNTAASGSILTVIGSGSAQPIFTVQGSQGELFSITDSLSGSLFSVNDISGLPILEVFSDNTTLIGNYQDPMLITTAKVVTTSTSSFTIYSLPTASYDTAFFEYSVRSGSNARAGTIMAIQSGSTVNFTETTTTDFGSTSAVSFTVIVTGSNMALTGSSTSGAWTIKTIVRGL